MTVKLPRIALALVVLVAAGCSSSHPSKSAGSTTTTTASTAPSTTGLAVPPTTGGSTAPSTTISAGGPRPTGFKVTDLSWVSDDQGWALGSAPCAHPPCTSVVHTLDGGRTWAGLPAPVAYLESDQLTASAAGPCSSTVACVHGIRFADASTGYAFGATSLWLTTNGGHTWSKRSTDPTDALEVSHGLVVRVTHPADSGCPPGCPYQVQTTSIGSTTWHTVASPKVTGVGAALAIDATNVYVGAPGHTAGGASDAHTSFARSTDRGAHWSTFADPCTTTPSGGEADASTFAAAPGGYLAVACTPRGPGEAGFVVVSADAGATFGPHRFGLLSTVPAGGEAVVAVAAPTGPRLVAVVLADGTYRIAVSNDAGADWSVTHSEPAAGRGGGYLGFEDATTGRAVLDPSVILTTTDGGGHWAPLVFP